MPSKVYCLKQFWKDIKDLKKHHIKGLEYQCSIIETEADFFKIAKLPLLDAVTNYISNNYRTISKNHVKNDRQPFLKNDIEIWKVDWATDSKGTRSGLRILYCTNIKDGAVYLVYLNTKANCANEKQLESDVFYRIKTHFNL